MDVEKIREGFPYLQDERTKTIAYLDNGATSQRPKVVLDKVYDYYVSSNANPHRGAYKLSYNSTLLYESAREKVGDFINADTNEIIFTRSTTEALNLVSYSYGLANLKEGDEILISILEHHSNLVNWQFVAKKTGAKIKYFYLDDDYNLDMVDFENKLNKNTKIVCCTGSSNVISTDINIKEIVKKAKAMGAITVVDGAQLIAHHKVDVKDIDCDFFAFSGHKMYSPMGIGVLYGKKELLDSLRPFNLGGDMIEYVYEQETSFRDVPTKFEGGTQNVGGAVGLSASIDYMNDIGIEDIEKREEELREYCYDRLSSLSYVDIYIPKDKSKRKGASVSFNVKGIHPHDVASILDNSDVAIRSGHHCAQPLHRYLGINASCRASFAFYNTKHEIDKFIEGLEMVKELMISGS